MNYRQVNSAVKQIERALRNSVARNDSVAEGHFRNVLMMMVAIKAEARLHQILYVPDGFTEAQRRAIISKQSLFDRWTSAVDSAYRARFSIPQGIAIHDRLMHSDLARFQTLHNFLSTELKDLIHLRNKFAHGQWIYPLDAGMNEVATHLKTFSSRETSQTLTLRNEAIDAIGNIVSDLIQSQQLFRSRFDSHYARVQKVDRSLKAANYATWSKRLRERHLRGLERIRREQSNIRPEGQKS